MALIFYFWKVRKLDYIPGFIAESGIPLQATIDKGIGDQEESTWGLQNHLYLISKIN